MRAADAIKADCTRVKDWLTGLWTHVEFNIPPMVQQLAQDGLDLLEEFARLRSRVAESESAIEAVREMQAAFRGGDDNRLEKAVSMALAVTLPANTPPAKEPS